MEDIRTLPSRPTPGAAPLALAFAEGRCRLVLSMRGNAEAQATPERIEPELLNATLELMAAHELGHCKRYLYGAWYGLPAGFVASEPDSLSSDLRAAYLNMQAVRAPPTSHAKPQAGSWRRASVPPRSVAGCPAAAWRAR